MNMKNASSENVSKMILICRLCGDASDSYINILGQDGIKHSINEKIMTYLNVEVSNSDLLPKIICNKCFHILDEFHNFFLISKKVQLLLKNTINESLFSIKIKIKLPENETSNNNRNLIKDDYKIYLFDNKREKANIENYLIYKKELFSLTDNYADDEKKGKIIKPVVISDQNVLENDNIEKNKILRINTSINNNNSLRYEDDQDYKNVKQTGTENNSVEFILENYRNTISSTYNDVNCHLPMKLNENSSKLIDAMQYNNDSTRLLCQNIDLSTDNEINLSKINTKTWTNNYNKKCEWKSENDLIDVPMRLSCTSCTQVFMYAEELIKHYSSQHHSSKPKFKCAICGKMYKVLKNFHIHYEKHNNVNKHICDICGKSFTRNWTLRIHASVHSDAKPFNCDECSKKFKNFSSLKNHKRSHLPDECKLIYTCAFCGNSFKSKFVLTTHERIHTGKKDFICDLCNKSFASKSSLLTHISTHNNTNQKIHCPVCNKLIRTEKLLKRHLAFHLSKKKLKCEYCGKEFHYSVQLNEHIRLHTGELPYECEYCQKRFRLNSTLIIHRRQHTGIKPYKCKVCNHSFTNWPNYNKHMKRKHYNIIIKESNDELVVLKI